MKVRGVVVRAVMERASLGGMHAVALRSKSCFHSEMDLIVQHERAGGETKRKSDSSSRGRIQHKRGKKLM